MRSRYAALSGLLTLALVAAGCTKPPVTTPPAPEPPKAEQPAPAPAPPKTEVTESIPREVPPPPQPVEFSVDEINKSGVLKTVYFDYDKSDLSDMTRATLQGNADWLKKNAKHAVEIGGHCDERGTIDYNIALGDRRANAVKDYLVSLGVNGANLAAVSYGKQRPADPSHNETAWAKNRRAEFLVTK